MNKLLLSAVSSVLLCAAGFSQASDGDHPQATLATNQTTHFEPGVIVTLGANGGFRRVAFGREGMEADLAMLKGRAAFLRKGLYAQERVERIEDQIKLMESSLAEATVAAKTVTLPPTNMCSHVVALEAASGTAGSYWIVYGTAEHFGNELPGPVPPNIPVARMYAEALATFPSAPTEFENYSIDLGHEQDGDARVGIRIPHGLACTGRAFASATMLSPPAGCTGVNAYRSVTEENSCAW